jgi:hypothetical protein
MTFGLPEVKIWILKAMEIKDGGTSVVKQLRPEGPG